MLLALTLLAALGAPADEPPARIAVGAIRWDAWYGTTGPVKAVEQSLGNRKYHFRLPFFARVLDADHVSINGDSDEIMARELGYAAEAGLAYWAFVDYWQQPELTAALRRYLAATDKRGVGFCLVEEGGRLDTEGPTGIPRLVGLFQRTEYQRVLGNRPLLFVFALPQRLGRPWFDQLRAATVAAGLGAPYLVLLGWQPERDWAAAQPLGFDAVSAYAAGGQYAGTMPTYEQLTARVREHYWAVCRRLGIPTVTFATTGWDTRPRIENPPPWCRWVKRVPDPRPLDQQIELRDAVTAEPAALTRHVREALAWTRANPAVCPSRTMLIYAWNENDEGGWLIPTLKPDGTADTSRLAALRLGTVYLTPADAPLAGPGAER